jgi:hypothetical protein
MSDSSSSKNGSLTALGIALALGLIIGSWLISSSLVKMKQENQTITIKGYAEKNITSDLATWTGEFTVNAPSLTAGYDKVKSDLQKVFNYFAKMGISKDKIEVSAVTIVRQYRLNEKGYATNEIIAYNMVQRLVITLNDIYSIDKISKESTSLIQDGIEFISYQPMYFYTKMNDLKLKMLGEATKDARNRAETLANNSKCSVGNLKSAQQGVFQITAPNSTETSDMGEFDVTTKEKTIKAVVTIEYSIK